MADVCELSKKINDNPMDFQSRFQRIDVFFKNKNWEELIAEFRFINEYYVEKIDKKDVNYLKAYADYLFVDENYTSASEILKTLYTEKHVNDADIRIYKDMLESSGLARISRKFNPDKWNADSNDSDEGVVFEVPTEERKKKGFLSKFKGKR